MGVAASDAMNMSDSVRVTPAHTTDTCVVREVFDSEYLSNETALVRKCQKDRALDSALRYFHREVLDDARPLYGIYKAMEALIQALAPCGNKNKGREKLAGLVDEKEKYIDDIMQTTDPVRHHLPTGKRVHSDAECRERARRLIEAYANSIKV